MALPHYAEAFCVLPGHCFRLVQAVDGTGHAQHCPHPAEWRGRFKDGTGTWHRVASCDGHREDLEAVQRVP